MTREEFVAAVDWGRVRADLVESRAELECAIAQRVAELRATAQPETLRDKEQLAAWQGNIAAIDDLAGLIASGG